MNSSRTHDTQNQWDQAKEEEARFEEQQGADQQQVLAPVIAQHSQDHVGHQGSDTGGRNQQALPAPP